MVLISKACTDTAALEDSTCCGSGEEGLLEDLPGCARLRAGVGTAAGVTGSPGCQEHHSQDSPEEGSLNLTAQEDDPVME